MRIYRFIMMCFALSFSAAALQAQMRIIPQERLEAVSNPRHSADSADLSFAQQHIFAEPMNEDDAPKTFVYKFTNVGKETISIRRLTTSCSCASAVCHQAAVKPGEEAEILVTYNPKGHPGKFERKVFIYTQEGNSPAAILKLSVDVAQGADLSGEWPLQMGNIRLRRSEVTFISGRRAVETVSFINLSGKTLQVGCEKAFLPECIAFESEPVEHNAEGQMRITYDPSEPESAGTVKLILKGLGVPPSKSSITIRIK